MLYINAGAANINDTFNDNFYGAVLMTMVTVRVHPVHLMNAD